MNPTASRQRLAGLILVLVACFGCAGAAPRVVTTESGERLPMAGDFSRIDHVILGINDLQKGIEELERLTGVRAVFSGAHPGRGTQNALISLGGAHYLEILAPNPDDPGAAAGQEELGALSTLTTIGWAAQGADLPALRERLLSQGVEIGEVRPGARNRPDGTRLSWQTLSFAPNKNADAGLPPFFIEWGPGTAHPSTTSPAGCRLTGFALEAAAPDALKATFQKAGLPVEIREGRPRIRISLECPSGKVEL